MSKTPDTVHLYPVAGSYVPGVPAIEQDVSPERAAELLAYTPPAFTTDPAAAATGPVQAYHLPTEWSAEPIPEE